MKDIDKEVIEQYLDNAVMHSVALNDWAEGFWLGRAVEHAHQNAVGADWFTAALDARGLDSAVVAIPKPGDPEPHLN